jgi:hypothetical protein
MSDPFDPYYTWLSIPPDEQPPNHYRLLGVKLLENNPDVIASAADRQMAHVRSFQSGQHATASQQLLNQLSAARLCLLDLRRKADYDRTLAPARDNATSAQTATVSASTVLPPAPAMQRPTPVRPLPVAQPAPATSPSAQTAAAPRPAAPAQPLRVPKPLLVRTRDATNSPPAVSEAAPGLDRSTVRPHATRRRVRQVPNPTYALTAVGALAVVVAIWAFTRSGGRPPAAQQASATDADTDTDSFDLGDSSGTARPPAPSGKQTLRVLDAQWGADNQRIELTEQLNELIHGRSLVCSVHFWLNLPDPYQGKPKQLELRYFLDDQITTATFPDGELVSLGTGPPRPKEKPRGLAITEARYGASNVWTDVTTATQNLVHDDRLDSWPAVDSGLLPGAKKILFVRYYLGDEEEYARFFDGEPILVGVPPDMRELPRNKWVNVLPLAAAEDLARLGWTRLNDNVHTTGRHMGENCLPLPVKIQGEYEIELECTRTGGGDLVGVGFPVDRNTASISMGHNGRGVGIDEIYSEQPDCGPLGLDLPIESHKLHKLLIRVGHEGPRTTVDGDMDGNKINWKGNPAGRAPNHFTPVTPGLLNVYTHICEWRLHSLKIRVLKGHAFVPVAKKPG